MMNSTLFLVLFVFINMSLLALSQPNNVAFSYLSFIWGPGFCRTINCIRNVNPDPRFTIHGLWPARADGTSIVNCDGPDWNHNTIELIEPELQRAWPSFIHPSRSFWRHEWNHHGKCSGLSLYRYFETGLRLSAYSRIMLRSLHVENIHESRDPVNTYIVNDFLNALWRRLGSRPQLRCRTHEENGVHTRYFTGVNLCFDRRFTLLDCPSSIHGCEPGQSTRARFYG